MKLAHLLTGKKKKQQSASRDSLHSIARDPYVDWVVVFSLSLVIAVILIVVGIFTYTNLEKQLTSSTQAGKNLASGNIDTKLLSSVLSQWSSLDTTRSSLLHGYDGPTDPSI